MSFWFDKFTEFYHTKAVPQEFRFGDRTWLYYTAKHKFFEWVHFAYNESIGKEDIFVGTAEAYTEVQFNANFRKFKAGYIIVNTVGWRQEHLKPPLSIQ